MIVRLLRRIYDLLAAPAGRTWHLLRSTLLVILFLGLGKLTGFVRVILVGARYGTGAEADAFTSANQLPEVFFVLIAGGALTAAFIPVYSGFLTGDRQGDAARLVNGVVTLVIALLGSVALLSAIFAPQLTRYVLVPSYTPEQQALTAGLMRVILIQTVLFGVSGILSSYLNAHQHFALPALAPIALDIGYVVGLYLLTPTLGIYGLAWGTVLGGVLHIGIQVPALIRHRFRYRFDWPLTRYGVGNIFAQLGGLLRGRVPPLPDGELGGLAEIIRLMGPRIVMLGAIQAADIFILRLGSTLEEGAVSGYFYAYTLMQLPQTLLGTSIAIVVFPTMAELYNGRDIEGLKRLAVTALRIIWVLTIPAGVALVLVGRPAIGLVLERGAFDAASTALVAGALAVFSVRVVSESTLEIVARLFYARHNTRTPMFTYLVWFLINVGLMYLLVDSQGIRGLALASSVAFTVLAAILYLLNRRELDGLGEQVLLHSGGRALLASGGMGLLIVGLQRLLDGTLLFLGVAVPAGLAVYFLLNHLLGGREIPELIRLIRRRQTAA